MSNYRITIDPPAIWTTGEAVGPNVCSSLRLARATLSDAVDEKIKHLREGKHAAIKTAEKDLPATPAPEPVEQKAAE